MRSFSQLFSSAGVDPERRNAVLLVGGIALVVALAFALIIFGYYTDRVAPRHDAVLRIGDRTFDYAFLERRIKADNARGQFNTQDVSQSIADSISRLQREELIRIIARDRGVTASGADIDAGLREALNLAPEANRDLIANRLRGELLQLELPLDDYLETIESSVLEDRLKQEFTAGLPADAEQVHLLLIAAGSQANAVLAKGMLDQGLPFAAAATQYSKDASASSGGDFGWAPREVLGPEIASVAFSISGRSDIIETEDDFYIIEVLDKQVMPIADDVKTEIGDRELLNLLKTKAEEVPFVSDLTQEQLIRIANAVGSQASG